MDLIPRALLCLGLCLPTLALATPCQEFEPATARLEGKLERQTHPGPPNFESIENGDEARTGFYLVLAEPACVKGNDYETDMGAEQDVRLVQLVLDEAGYKKLEPHLGQQVTLAGHLFSAETAFHYAPLLMQDVQRVEDQPTASADCEALAAKAADAPGFHPPWWGTVQGEGRLHFHSAPDKACAIPGLFIIPGDGVTIYAAENGWMQVMYINSRGEDFTGWVDENRLDAGPSRSEDDGQPEEQGEPAATTADLPGDVASFAERYANCEHFLGEEPYDAERAKELAQAVEELCTGIDAQLDALRQRYRDDAAVTQALAGYEKVE
ncbi:hypothetical protein PHLH8_23170 [Pseudomonas sp. Pc102]|uniref:DUF4431 domain-containing protein n=1 Tax=Pseudomonas sp. Pc102 TaxID=2678261 RepID=UPI001BCAF951|nr:DUF4431 domain-containing protein [Pseudomonas sp. Pc102]BBP82675.1 hypothetical protein PHLH8_23170 [Pseudomonas sp. Pc102]